MAKGKIRPHELLGFKLRLAEEVSGKPVPAAKAGCSNQALSTRTPQLPYDTCTANRYQRLGAEAEKTVGLCYDKALLELGLGLG